MKTVRLTNQRDSCWRQLQKLSYDPSRTSKQVFRLSSIRESGHPRNLRLHNGQMRAYQIRVHIALVWGLYWGNNRGIWSEQSIETKVHFDRKV